MRRFDRQILLPEIGVEGQEKLLKAKVLIVGAGGLGTPIIQYLAAAGVGTIGIIDGDHIEESNLNRQLLFGVKDVGESKADRVGALLKAEYPELSVPIYKKFLNTQNALSIIPEFDLVIDGTDNFGTRYLINDACVLLGKPFIMGAIYKYEGQVAVFNEGVNPVNYRDLHAIEPSADEVPNCSETGVLGTLPGLIGMLQATEALKFFTGIGQLISGKVLYYDLKSVEFFHIHLKPSPVGRAELPENEKAFLKKQYKTPKLAPDFIKWNELYQGPGIGAYTLIDIRDPGEEPNIETNYVHQIPLRNLQENPGQLENMGAVVLFCQTGSRSKYLAGFLKEIYPEKSIFSVEGGILDLNSPLFKDYEEKFKKYIH